MKKSIVLAAMALFAILAFTKTGNAQALIITNNQTYDFTATICGGSYTVPASSSASFSACTPAPCSFQVQLACSPAMTFNDPNCGGACPSSSTINFAGVVVPPCPSYSVTYAVDCFGNITITVN